jgi:hypothetical protein
MVCLGLDRGIPGTPQDNLCTRRDSKSASPKYVRISASGTNLLRDSSLVILNLLQSVALVITFHADLTNRSKRTAPRWRNWFANCTVGLAPQIFCDVLTEYERCLPRLSVWSYSYLRQIINKKLARKNVPWTNRITNGFIFLVWSLTPLFPLPFTVCERYLRRSLFHTIVLVTNRIAR